MWTRIRAVIVEDEPLASQYLATLLDETCQVEVVGTASEAGAALARCAELRPDVVFLDIHLPGQDGMALATQLGMLPQPPRVVFTTGHSDRAAEAFRLEAVDYLLKPLDPEQVTETVDRLLAYLRPFETRPSSHFHPHVEGAITPDQSGLTGELLPVNDADRDQVRLLARREIAAAIRRNRRTWVHTVREEFATYYPLTHLTDWLGGEPFLQVGRQAVVNLRAIEHVTHYGDRLYRVRLRDRTGTEITVSRSGAVRLAAVLKPR